MADVTRPTVVSLGDSITFGHGLGPDLNPSRRAYPYLIGKAAHLDVIDLGVSGWTSRRLLDNLSSPLFRQAIIHAHIITLDIGTNDWLHPTLRHRFFKRQSVKVLRLEERQVFSSIFRHYAHHLARILTTIRLLNPQAPILLYNLYNPVSPSRVAVYQIINPIIIQLNSTIARYASKTPHTSLVNAYQAFSGHTNHYLLSDHIHPNPHGQRILAELGLKFVPTVQPKTFLTSATPTYAPK